MYIRTLIFGRKSELRCGNGSPAAIFSFQENRKSMKTVNTPMFSGFRIAVILIFAFITTIQYSAAQSWYNTSWQYRIPITITNPGAELPTCQVNVNLDGLFTWGHAQADGGDVFFTATDGTTPLDFWIESWTPSTSASIWVELAPLPAGETEIYMYYGNLSALSASNGSNTFLFFDDFETGTIDAAKWTTNGTITRAVIDEAGNDVLRVMTVSAAHFNFVRTAVGLSFSDFVLEMKVKMQNDVNNSCTPEIGFRFTNNQNNYITMLRGEGLVGGGGPNGDLFIRRYYNNVQTNFTYPAYNYTANYYYDYKIAANGTTISAYLDDVPLRTWEDTGSPITAGAVGLGIYGTNNNYVYYDDVRIRVFTASEPTAVAGPEANQLPPLTVTGVVTNVSCAGGNNGAINITVTDGSGDYDFEWLPGGQLTEDLSNLAAGTYSVRVTDNVSGSLGNAGFTVTEPSPLIVTYSISNLPVCGTGEATVTISASGGTPPYTGTGTFGQEVGTENYTVTDANLCQTTVPVTVSSASAWYDNAWTHRMPLDISNETGAELVDFQVEVNLGSSFDFSKVNADGSDIRFTPVGSSEELSFWIELWDAVGNQATVWVKIPSIPAGGTSINMYYGNPAATSASNGTATFRFFDDFSAAGTQVGNWVRTLSYSGGIWGPGYVAHDWKYVMEMQQGSMYYAIARAQNGWATPSLDAEIEQEFNYIHSQMRPDGTVNPDSYLNNEPQYCYGTLLSSVALGYLHYSGAGSNATLAAQCYDDLILLFDRLRSVYPTVANLSDAGGYGMLLHGFSNAWKAFTASADATRTSQALNIVQTYANTFINNQAASGAWTGAQRVQEQLKRDFGVLKAFDVTGNTAYLDAVEDNINYILNTYWRTSDGGLEWLETPTGSDQFYECHQQWFMIAVRLLHTASGGTRNYLSYGQAAWLFLTDNNFLGIDMYVHNLDNHQAFFSYRQIEEDGTIQADSWKGSYEVGTALWGMSLNYDWVSNHRSAYSLSQGLGYFNYLGEMVAQVRNTPSGHGFYNSMGTGLNSSLWTVVGSPAVSIVNDDGNNVASLLANASHNDLVTTNTDNTGTFDDFILEMKVRMNADDNDDCNPEVDFRYIDNGNRYLTQLRGETQNDFFMRRYTGGTGNDLVTQSYNYTANVYYNYKLAVNGDVISAYLNDVNLTTYTDPGTTITQGGISLHNYRSASPAYFDDVRVREIATVEPVVTMGEEQSGFDWIGCEDSDWNNPANWLTGVIPGTLDDVVISVSGNYPAITGTLTCNSISVSPGACLTVESGAVLNSAVTINTSAPDNNGSLVNLGVINGQITYNRFLRPEDQLGDRHFFASPVGNQDAGVFITNNSSKVYQLWTYVESTGSWSLLTLGNFRPGRGYNVDQVEESDGLLTFTGISINSASFSASSPYATGYTNRSTPEDYHELARWATGRSWENYGGGGWNLMGNPFASAMDAGAFIAANSGSFDPHYQALYVYDGTTNVYRYAAATVPGYPSGPGSFGNYVQAGQGFYALALYNNISFSFTPAMQVHQSDLVLMKSAGIEDPWPGLVLKVNHSSGEASTTIIYNEDMSTGVDPGFDVGMLSTGADLEVYTSLVQKDNNINFARQALPLIDYDRTSVPLGIDFKKGGEITLSAATVPIGNNKFWLEDRVTGIFTDLTTKSYTVTLPVNTFGTGRFFIIASTNTPTTINLPENDDSDIRIWNTGNKVIIKGNLDVGANCEIYELTGRKVMEHRLTDNQMNIIDLPSGIKGILFIRVTDGGNVTVRKLTIL